MTSALFLSRVRLRKDASVATLRGIILTQDQNQRVTNAHKLLWTLFADDAARRRDFLWREARPGEFYLLSGREPRDAHALFDLDPPKPFVPSLQAGDRLAFSLRANPTVARKRGAAPGERGRRSDVVMDAIKPLPKGERASPRQEAMQQAGETWLRRQGERHGFSLERLRADRYRILRPPHRQSRMQIATLDFDGVLSVTEPTDFIPALAKGFGRAKAYGCGLMLIRRA